MPEPHTNFGINPGGVVAEGFSTSLTRLLRSDTDSLLLGASRLIRNLSGIYNNVKLIQNHDVYVTSKLICNFFLTF